MGSTLDSFKEQIDHMLQQGIYNCQVIYERLQEFGYLLMGGKVQ